MEEEFKFCKNCKRDINAKNYVIHSVHCERKIQLCDRCSEPVPRSELEKHEDEFHSKIDCSECGISVEKWQVEKHKEVCLKKLVPCEYCELEVRLDRFSEHISVCGSRTDQCHKCKKHIMLKDLEKHQRYCPRMEAEALSCEYCDLQINRNEFAKHSTACGTRSERCFLCNEHVMIKDRNVHFINCSKTLKLNESISCDFCGGSFSDSVIGRHVELCKADTVKCDKCNSYIQRKDMEFHLTSCKVQKNRLKLEFPCQYCRKLIPCDFLESHAEACGSQPQKCKKCGKNVPLKNLETHSNVCKENVSKTHGNCPVCHESVPWVDMNVHSAYCAQVNSEVHEYERQNQLNELALRKESEASVSSAEKKSQFHVDGKRCTFCFEKFPCYDFGQHLKVCQERPFDCNVCLKPMPYRKKEEHEKNCQRMVANDYSLRSEEKDDNNKLKKLKKCQFCDKRFPDVLFHHHLNDCEHRKEKCTFCSENVPLKDIENHRLLKCNLAGLAGNKNFNNPNKTNADAFPEPSKYSENKIYLEQIVEVCPSCHCKIPEERYHEHLLLCYNNETRCHFCGQKISKKNEHTHFRICSGILQIVDENNASSKKKKGNIKKGKSITELVTSWFIPLSEEKSFERNNTKQVSQESYSQRSYRRQNYERDNMKSVYPTASLNEVNELPCEFCNQMWPSELLIEHESGCRPDLVSFPKANEGNNDEQIFAAAAAVTVSQKSVAPVLSTSPKSWRKEDVERRAQSRRDQTSFSERINCRERERNAYQKQVNDKEKFFFYPSKDTDDISRNQSNFKKKRYPQLVESQEVSKTKPEKEIGVKKDDLKKNQFTSFKFSTFRNDEEIENSSYSIKEIGDELSTDMENCDQTKKKDSCNLPTLSAESSAVVDYPKSDFNRKIGAIGSERNERKRIIHYMEGVDLKKDLKEISVQKLVPFDENLKSERDLMKTPYVLKTTENRAFNQTIPELWNSESTLSIDKTLGNRSLKFFGDNYDNEAFTSNDIENIKPRSFTSSREEADYDAKNSETFGSNFGESINNNQNEENDNEAKSERSNSDDIFYDADDGSAKCFDTENDNLHGGSTTLEEKSSHYDFHNLNFGSNNQKYNINSHDHGDFTTNIKMEEEDLNQIDCDLNGYFQFFHKRIKQSDETAQRMIGEVEKLCETAKMCKCHNAKCSCELLSLTHKTSSFQAHSLEDASCSEIHPESMDIEPLGTKINIKDEMKSKKHMSSEKKGENKNVDELKWKKWRVSQQKVLFSSDSE